MLVHDNKVVLDNGRWIIGYRGPEPPPPPSVYNVILNQTTGGIISASPMSGIDGTTVTLSNSPSTNYTFNSYNVAGATLYDGNKFDINGQSVYCTANWNYTPVLRRLTITQTSNGTISASQVTGYDGDVVTLSNTPNTYYAFNGYNVTGATLYDGNKFKFNGSDVNVTGTFYYHYVDPVVGDTVKIGNQIWMKYNLKVDDGNGDIWKVNNVSANGLNMGTQYYYSYDAAYRVANSISGWHLPSRQEWITLFGSVGGFDVAAKKLKSTSGWKNNGNGTNDYGFNGMPAGDYYPSGSTHLLDVGSQGSWWTSEAKDSTNAYYQIFDYRWDKIVYSQSAFNSRWWGYNVRLVKNS